MRKSPIPGLTPSRWTLQLESTVDAGCSCSRPDPCGDFASLVFWKAKPPQSNGLRRLTPTRVLRCCLLKAARQGNRTRL